MFGLFKSKSKEEKLNAKIEALQQEAFRLSKTNRKASDEKAAEAQALKDELNQLQKKQA